MFKRPNLENRDNSRVRVLFSAPVMSNLMIKFIGVMILISTILPQALYSQAPAIEWVNLYGEYAQGRGIQVTPDNGYIACGFIGQVDDEDYYLVRVNSDGDTLWTRRYDFFNAGNEALYSIDLASDGGYVATGYGDWNGISLKCFTLKVNSVGDTVWSRTYTTISQGNSISRTSDEGYIIAGMGWNSGGQKMTLHKIDSEGDVMWTKYCGPYWAWDVQQTTDGGYIVTGSTGGGAGSSDVSLVKTDSVGDTIWTKTFSRGRRGLNVQQTTDGGYIVSGYGYIGTTLSPCVIKTNADGDTLWTKLYPTSYCTGSHVKQTPDGGYIFAESAINDLLRKTDSEGNTTWTYSLPSYGYNHIHSIQITPENGYIVAGYDWPSGSPGTQVYIAKTEPDPMNQMNPPNNLEATIVDYNDVHLEWEQPIPSDESRDLLGYKVYRDDEVIYETMNPDDLFYDDLALAEADYTYYVTAVYDVGESLPSNVVTIEVILSAPQNPQAVTQQQDILVTWNAPAVRALSYYRVYRDLVQIADNIIETSYLDENMPAGTYTYNITAVYDGGYESVMSPDAIIEHNPVDANGVLIPLKTELFGNYPNPFNPETTINFSLKSDSKVVLEIFGIKGQKVKTLVNDRLNAGTHQVVWSGKDENGKSVTSGIYFYRITAGNYSETKKCVILK
ncbi:MAG: T9SS type A sorting domain-containing protein [Candidatus Cloacimonetes bacterium]|nr:T9SS type A sorting domain-containing protein [Candidatus Cloacimonadota bacterium]